MIQKTILQKYMFINFWIFYATVLIIPVIQAGEGEFATRENLEPSNDNSRQEDREKRAKEEQKRTTNRIPKIKNQTRTERNSFNDLNKNSDLSDPFRNQGVRRPDLNRASNVEENKQNQLQAKRQDDEAINAFRVTINDPVIKDALNQVTDPELISDLDSGTINPKTITMAQDAVKNAANLDVSNMSKNEQETVKNSASRLAEILKKRIAETKADAEKVFDNFQKKLEETFTMEPRKTFVDRLIKEYINKPLIDIENIEKKWQTLNPMVRVILVMALAAAILNGILYALYKKTHDDDLIGVMISLSASLLLITGLLMEGANKKMIGRNDRNQLWLSENPY